MGMFMASLSFRCLDKAEWHNIKPEIENMFQGVDGLVTNLDTEGPGYVVLSPYGDMGEFLGELPGKISALTGDYAVMAMCVDSDFNVIELYNAGTLLERSCIGELYDEYKEFMEINQPNVELWKPLLIEQNQMDALEYALFGEEVFAEDSLRKLSKLTGLPIFADELMFADYD